MNELTRTRYLQALGTEAYISRRQLPGAAVTRRLAIVRKPPARDIPQDVSAPVSSAANAVAAPVKMPRLEAVPKAAAQESAAPQPAQRKEDPKFSLVAISCGGWLWLEEQTHESRLSDQLLLIQAMASALGLMSQGEGGRAQATQFEWPIHNNRQLDQGEQAARSSVAGFIQRKLEQLGCQGLVLLGAEGEGRLALDQLECSRLVRTLSTAQMLRNPLLKRQACRDLQQVRRSA